MCMDINSLSTQSITNIFAHKTVTHNYRTVEHADGNTVTRADTVTQYLVYNLDGDTVRENERGRNIDITV